MLIVVADSHELRYVDGGARALELRGEEVAEALAAEAVDIVDGVALTRQRVHVHARARGHGCVGDRQHSALIKGPRRHCWDFRTVGRIATEGHADVHHLTDRWIRWSRCDEGNR